MTSLLTNYSFLSPLKRQRALRNRSNNNNPTTPSKRANRLPAVPELSGEHDDESSSSCSAATSSSSSTPSHSTSPKAKRLSRYGKDQFGAFALTDDFLTAPPRAAPQPPSSPRLRSSSSSTKPIRQSVRLSAFDMIIDISASEPASPVSETPAEPSTPPRPRDLDCRSPPRSRSPTPSLTSMSACSSTEMPTTPGASDDEFPTLRSPSDKMAVARPRISKHPLMLIKSSSPSSLASDENSEDTFEFTLVPFSPVPGLEAEIREVQEEDEEDDALWYSRELSQVISLSSPRAPSNSPTRPDSLLPLPRDSSSGTDRPSARSRMSKPLPAVPHPAVPNPHLDPTYPQSLILPPRLTLHASTHPSMPPSPLSLPSPVTPTSLYKRQSRRFPPPSAPPTSSLPACKSLTITVPRPSHQNSKDIVSEILNDVNAWSLGTPSTTGSSTRSSTLILSPPRIPHSPALSVFSEFDPVEFIVSYAAAQPPSPAAPAPATSATAFAATFLDLDDEDEDEEAEAEAGVTDANSDRRVRSRWSCSTLATLAAPSSPTTTTSSPSARIRFHLASVARRVRVRRAGGNNNNGNNNNSNSNNNNSGSNNNGCGETAAGSMHVRSSSESALSGSSSGSVSGTAFETTTACSGSDLRRKPIPFELLSR